MQSARMSVTAVASDKVKHQKLNFYINGRISNFSRIQNVQLSHTDEGGNFIYSLSENMECFIEESQTLVSVEKELKRFQKKMEGFSTEDKLNGFVNCIRGTYDFIYGVSGENEIEFSKDKLFTGFILSDGKLKAVSTNYNSFYRIRNGNVDNLIEKIEKPSYAVEKPKEAEYSPSKGVVKEFETDDIAAGDIFLFATTNVNTRLDNEVITEFLDKDDNAEEIAWKAVNEAGNHSIDDNLIVISVLVSGLSEKRFLETVEAVTPVKAVKSAPDISENKEDEIKETAEEKETPSEEKKHGFFNAAASLFKTSGKENKESVDTEVDLDETTLVEEEPEPETVPETETEDKTLESKKTGLSFPGLSGDFRKLNVKRPGFMKRRMNIYLKRLLSIIIVLVLMAGIVWGMYHLLKLIFTDKDEPVEFVSPPPATVTPIPTPEPTPEPTATPEPTPEPTPEQVYMEYTVQSGDTLSKISATFYNGQNKVAEIVAYNENITDANSIRVGQVIKLPILEGIDPNDGN